MKNELKQMGLFTVGPFLSKILSFLLLPIISYFVSLTDYGQYTIFTMLLLYFQTYITMSTEQYFLRAYELHSAKKLRKVLLLLFLVNEFTILFVCVLVSLLFSQLSGQIYIWIFASLVSYFTVVQDLYSRVFRSQNLGNYYSLSVAIMQIANFFGSLFTVILMKNVLGLILGQLIGVIIGTVATRAIAYKTVFLSEDSYNFKINKTIFVTLKGALKYSLPLLPGVFLWIVQTSIGRLFLSDNSQLLGIYGVGFKFSAITNLFVSSFLVYWEPKIFKIFDQKKNDDEYISQVKIFRQLYSIIIETIIAGLIIVLPIISYTMSKEYKQAMFILPLMALTNYINGFNYFEGFGPQLTGKTHKTIIPLVISVSVNILLLIVFGKNNIIAVVVATNVSFLIQLILNSLISLKMVPKIEISSTMIRIILYNIAMVLYALYQNYLMIVILTLLILFLMNYKSLKYYFNKILAGRRF